MPVVRLPSVELPVVTSIPVGVPHRRLLTALRAFRPDVVHLAAPFVVGSAGLAAARRIGAPTVAVYQTDVAGFASSYGLGLTARAAWRWTCRLHAQAARTLAPSSWAIAELRARGVPRVHRWARGVDAARFTPRKRCAGLRATLAPHGEVLVGYVGRLAAEKRVDLLAPLARQHGVRLVVVGSGPLERSLRAAMPDAVFLGERHGAQLGRIYASLDVFAHAGPFETFGQTVQEALASGLAVVAPATGGPLDLVDPGRTGYLVPPEDAGALAEAVGILVANPALRLAFGRAARAEVAGRTWAAVGDELIGHYVAVHSGGMPAPRLNVPA